MENVYYIANQLTYAKYTYPRNIRSNSLQEDATIVKNCKRNAEEYHFFMCTSILPKKKDFGKKKYFLVLYITDFTSKIIGDVSRFLSTQL